MATSMFIEGTSNLVPKRDFAAAASVGKAPRPPQDEGGRRPAFSFTFLELGLPSSQLFPRRGRIKQRRYELEHCRQGDQDELRIEMTRILDGRGYQT